MRPLLSVVVPTIRGRERWLNRCVEAYARTLQAEGVRHRCQMLVLRGRPTCGVAWNEGIAQAEGEFIQLSADDLEPLDGWLLPAVETARRGKLPAARILNADRTLQSCGSDDQEHDEGSISVVARIPFATREQFKAIGPMLEEQYMGDYWFSHRGRRCGFPSVVVRDYCFIHHYAPEGRNEARMQRDYRAFRARGGRP